MKTKLLIAPILFLAAIASGVASIQVYFSPYGGCTQAICQEIACAKQELRIQAYQFTSAPIALAVMEASKRGVHVTALMDKCNLSSKYSSADFLQRTGATVLIDSEPAIAHSKVIIVDEVKVITGSFNFTKAAEERNVENLLVIEDGITVSQYIKHFEQRKERCKPWKRD